MFAKKCMAGGRTFPSHAGKSPIKSLIDIGVSPIGIGLNNSEMSSLFWSGEQCAVQVYTALHRSLQGRRDIM